MSFESDEEKAAYLQGRRDSDVDGRLHDHEKRLLAINGSVEKHARNVDALRVSMEEIAEKMTAKIDLLATRLDSRDAVEADRVAQVKKANEKQISNKQFWLGVATICVMILVALLAKVHFG